MEKDRLKADLHVHTVASGHAYSTVREICGQASGKGMELVAIADHGPSMPGAPYVYHFTNMVSLPREIDGVRILRSAECNIINTDGELDLPDKALEVLDIVHAGLHPMCGYDGESMEDNTRAVIGAIESGKVDVIVHPGNPLFPLDYETIAWVAASNGVALEINNASFMFVRKGSEDNCRVVIEKAIQNEALLTVGSDAHEASLVGYFDKAIDLINESGVSPEVIVNRGEAEVMEFLAGRGRRTRYP
ncbi:MAG: PHP domain-containing protein [Actinobacteria bacterium]|nr:PHP domain-containing protein [Actinomycetota bacterium]